MKVINGKTHDFLMLLERDDLIYYLSEVIEGLCGKIKDKLIAPYAALQVVDKENPPEHLLEAGRSEINWIRHSYLPAVLSSMKGKIEEYKSRCKDHW